LTDEEPQEYTCPECGSAFPEGSEKCPDCGLVFDWSEETDYICPDCGATVHGEAGACPECGAQFVHDLKQDTGYAEERTIDAMLDAAVAETLVSPSREKLDLTPVDAEETSVGEGAQDADGGPAPEEGVPPAPAIGDSGTATESEEYEEIEIPAEGEEAAPSATPPKKRPRATARRYAGGFTKVGLVFVVLSGVALVLTIVALRWDAISSGSRYETIGTMQSMVIMAGIAGFMVSALLSVWDLLRGPRTAEQ
jgi:DNA-directed RNA polymerase subunit RPC12/RpoP